jgi:hypothetical protein
MAQRELPDTTVPTFRFSRTHYWDVFIQTFDDPVDASPSAPFDVTLRLRADERALALLMAERAGRKPQ